MKRHNELVCKLLNIDREERAEITDPVTGHSFRVLMEEAGGWNLHLVENPRVLIFGKEYEVLITDELREAIIHVYAEAIGAPQIPKVLP